MPLIGTAVSHSNIQRVPRPSILGRIGDALWIVIIVLALPLGILILGAPLAFLIKLVLDAVS